MCQKETNYVLRENTTPSMMGEIVLPPLNVASIVPADSGNQEICRSRAVIVESVGPEFGSKFLADEVNLLIQEWHRHFTRRRVENGIESNFSRFFKCFIERRR